MLKQVRQLFPLLLLIFIDSFSYFVVIPILLKLFFAGHYSILPSDVSMKTRDFLTGLTISLSTIASLIAAPIVGNLSDKYGRKKTILGCLVAVMIGFLLPIVGIVKKSVVLILMGRLLSGVGSASQPVAQAAVTDLCRGNEKSVFLSLIALMMTLAIIAGPLVGGCFSHPETPYFLALSFSALSSLIIFFGFKETMHASAQTDILSISSVFFGLKNAIRTYHIGLLLLVFFCLELGWSQYYQTISLYLSQQLHYSVPRISFFNAYMGILMSLGLLLIYPVLHYYVSVQKIMQGSVLLVFLGLVCCVLFPADQYLFVSAVAVFTGTAYVSLLTLISNRVASQKQGWIMGYLSTILFSAWMFTGFNGGWLISIDPALPLWIAALALLVGVIAAMRVVYQKSSRFDAKTSGADI